MLSWVLALPFIADAILNDRLNAAPTGDQKLPGDEHPSPFPEVCTLRHLSCQLRLGVIATDMTTYQRPMSTVLYECQRKRAISIL